MRHGKAEAHRARNEISAPLLCQPLCSTGVRWTWLVRAWPVWKVCAWPATAGRGVTPLQLRVCEKVTIVALWVGGQVREVDLATGQVTIEYKGPQKLTFGLELTLKESPLIRQVTFV